MKVKIVEVGPRDGLQNEAVTLNVNTRLEFVKRLALAGLDVVEAGAFVSPKWIPQMSKTDQLMLRLNQDIKKSQVLKRKRFPCLVPNVKGMEMALESGVKEIAIFGACSESFSQKNINCSIKESFQRFEQVMALAKKNKVKVRGYLSTVFGCPYEGKVPQARVLKNIEQMLDLGVYEVSLGDTIGVTSPKQVRQIVGRTDSAFGLSKIALHFHDTRGTAMANVLAGLDMGVKTFDSSVGGLGGCPYARGAAGNLATEDLVYMLETMGVKTGVDLKKLVDVSLWISKFINRNLPAKLPLTF